MFRSESVTPSTVHSAPTNLDVAFVSTNQALQAVLLGKNGTAGGSNYAFADGSARYLKFGESLNPINLWFVDEGLRKLGASKGRAGELASGLSARAQGALGAYLEAVQRAERGAR